MNAPTHIDEFGFLPIPISLRFGAYLVEPIHAELLPPPWIGGRDWVDDTWMSAWDVARALPEPTEQQAAGLLVTDALWQLAPTHSIRRVDSLALSADFRRGEGAFIIHAIAFWYRVRAQFASWWFDARIPRKASPVAVASHAEIEGLLTSALTRYTQLSPDARVMLTNALFLHGRSLSYALDWERLLATYMTFEALGNVWAALKGISWRDLGHSKRFSALATDLGVIVDDTAFSRFAQLRNDLIHQGLWDMSAPGIAQPGTARSTDSFLAAFEIRRFNERVLIAMLDPSADASRARWTGVPGMAMLYERRGPSP